MKLKCLGVPGFLSQGWVVRILGGFQFQVLGEGVLHFRDGTAPLSSDHIVQITGEGWRQAIVSWWYEPWRRDIEGDREQGCLRGSQNH